MTTIVNIRDCEPGWEQSSDYVYVGRAGHGHDGEWGNHHPIGWCFTCGAFHDRAEAAAKHAEETRARYATDPSYRIRMGRLKDKKLVCFCKKKNKNVACHADVYVDILERT